MVLEIQEKLSLFSFDKSDSFFYACGSQSL